MSKVLGSIFGGGGDAPKPPKDKEAEKAAAELRGRNARRNPFTSTIMTDMYSQALKSKTGS